MDANVILVVMDSVRAKNTSLHGYRRDTTPFLNSLAEECATIYTQARAPGNWTLPSHVSMFTGYHVTEHGITVRHDSLEPGHTIWDHLDSEGYDTGVFSESPFLTDVDTGLASGFDTAISIREKLLPFTDAVNPYPYADDPLGFLGAGLRSGKPVRSFLNGFLRQYDNGLTKRLNGIIGRDVPPARVCIDEVIDWVESTSGPSAACLNLMDAHWPYEPQPEYDRWATPTQHALRDEIADQLWAFEGEQRDWEDWEQMEDLYDGAIYQIDQQLARLVDTLREWGEFEETMLVVTSDHGEGFGEQAQLRPGVRVREHGGGTLHESVTHVPLLVKFPGQTEPETVDSVETLTNLPAMIVDALDVEVDTDRWRTRRPTLVSTRGIDEDESKFDTASEYCGEMWKYTGHARAVYEDHDNHVRKHATWESNGETTVRSLAIYDAHISERIEADNRERVTEAFAPLADCGIRHDGNPSGDSDIDPDTEQRLSELGYL